MENGIIGKEALLIHWQGHRNLTRRVIEKFPEKDLFAFSIGGMRPFSEMVKELLTVDVFGLQAIVDRSAKSDHSKPTYTTKEELLHAWDEATSQIDLLYNQISGKDFAETFNLFGIFNKPIIENILYFIDNQIHHRGQGYVYLRALGIEPPAFWKR